MRKQVIGALCIALLAGCSTASVETETPANGTADETAVRTAVNEEAAAVSYEDVMKAAEQIGSAVAEGRWEEAAAAFSASAEGTRDAQGLKELWDAAEHEGPYQVLEADPLFHNGHIGCTVLIQTADGTVMEVLARMNEELRIEKMKFAERPAIAEAESAETWTETVIYAGNAPKISGILTLPVNEETDEKTEAEEEPVLPPVAVLLGEEMDDPMNESGSNTELRRDLARSLAEHGIASVRFDSRLYENPDLADVFGYDLSLIIEEDVASIFHSVEQYPVNARRIVCVGHGAAGTMGYSHVYHHFEVTGGLVLINAPFTEDGVHLFQRAAWLDEALADEAKAAIEAEADDSAYIGNYPLSYWQQWNRMGALLYTRFVAIPILIQQGKEDGIVTPSSDYENWKTQKGSNVTMKLYPDIGHDLRGKDSTFEDLIAEDIADWLNGVDINKKKPEPTPTPSASPAASASPAPSASPSAGARS